MNPNRFIRFAVYLFSALLIASTTFAQEKSDTIFYNSNWQICEQPIAEYYRVCTLNKNESIYFKDKVEDYTISDTLLMRGFYNNSAERDGIFTFYYKNGKKEREGRYQKNILKDKWSYYREDGTLYFQVQFNEDDEFIPLLIVGEKGDTVIANGDGKFSFDTEDYPDIFSEEYIIEGTCTNGARDGEWNYYTSMPEKINFLTEYYENGKFKKGKEKRIFDYTHRTRKSAQILNFKISKLYTTENFEADRVFGSRFQKDYQVKLANFLVYKQLPLIEVKPASYNNNIAFIIPQLRAGIKRSILGVSERTMIVYDIPDDDFNGDTYTVAAVGQPAYVREGIDSSVNVTTLDNIKAEVSFTIMPDGTLDDLNATTNLTKEFVTPMLYYLAKLRGLVPVMQNGQAVASRMKLYLYVKSAQQISASKKYLISSFIVSTKPNITHSVR